MSDGHGGGRFIWTLREDLLNSASRNQIEMLTNQLAAAERKANQAERDKVRRYARRGLDERLLRHAESAL